MQLFHPLGKPCLIFTMLWRKLLWFYNLISIPLNCEYLVKYKPLIWWIQWNDSNLVSCYYNCISSMFFIDLYEQIYCRLTRHYHKDSKTCSMEIRILNIDPEAALLMSDPFSEQLTPCGLVPTHFPSLLLDSQHHNEVSLSLCSQVTGPAFEQTISEMFSFCNLFINTLISSL